MKPRAIAFVGDNQARALAELYRTQFAHHTGERVTFLPRDTRAPIAADIAARFDVICIQRKADAADALAEPHDAAILFPFLDGAFAWPFSARAAGAAPGQYRDYFLDSLIATGATPAAARDRYLSFDVAGEGSVAALRTAAFARQRTLDSQTGFAIAPYIARQHQAEQLFLSPDIPSARLIATLAGQLFAKLGASRSEVASTEAAAAWLPRLGGELPIHPAVIRTLGLGFLSDATRFVCDDGRDRSFADYAFDYAQGWRPSDVEPPMPSPGYAERLGDAAALMARGAIDDAVGVLGQLIRSHPDASAAHAMLAEAHLRAGRNDFAAAAARDAVAIAPDNGRTSHILALTSLRNGDFDVAETAARRALMIAPWSCDNRNVLAEVLEERDARGEAIETLRRGMAAGSANAQSYSLLGNFLWRNADLSGAREAFAVGAAMDPAREDMRQALIELP